MHIQACTHTRIDITDETAQPRKNAMEDVTTTSDQGPPATGCVARLMRSASALVYLYVLLFFATFRLC